MLFTNNQAPLSSLRQRNISSQRRCPDSLSLCINLPNLALNRALNFFIDDLQCTHQTSVPSQHQQLWTELVLAQRNMRLRAFPHKLQGTARVCKIEMSG